MTFNTLNKKAIAASLTGLLTFSGSALADLGDYSAVQSLWNLSHPAAANNPVDDQLKNKMPFMTFNENPADSTGFDDGFKAKKYLQWQTISLKGDDDKNGPGSVKCLNGDDYKFVIKRSHSSSNMVVFFEAGGGCWDYDSCTKTSGGKTNAGLVGDKVDGIDPEIALRAASQASLFTSSLRPNYAPKYKNWTKVYLPYCTQDLGLGNSYNTYIDGDASMTASQRGMTVQGAVLTWLKANLEQPKQLIVSGQSAGGFASELLYHTYRTALAPEKGYMFNDAGPIMLAPQDESEDVYPSQHAHRQVTESWKAMPYLQWLASESSHLATDQRFVPTNMGTISNFLSARWPNDRFALIAARKDNTISGFTYNSFFQDIADESSLENRDSMRDEKRLSEMDRKRAQLDTLDNYGYFAPGYRPFFGGHVLSFPLIEASTKNEDDGNTIFDIIDNVLNDTGRVMSSWEGDAGLALDINGRYTDCINQFFLEGDGGMKMGDVYLDVDYPEAEGNVLAETAPCLANTHVSDEADFAILASILPWATQDVMGIDPLSGMVSSESLLTEQIKGLSDITAKDAAAFAARNIADTIRIGKGVLAAQAAKAKAKAAAIAKARAAAVAKAKAKAAAIAKARAAAAAKAKAAAEAAAAKAKAAAKKFTSRFRRRR